MNRKEAGKSLADALKEYKNKPDTIVLGLPRGGVVPAFEIAQQLDLPMDIIVTRKIGAPFQPELAVGALTQEGKAIFNDQLTILGLSQEQLEPIIKQERIEGKRRLERYRPGRTPLALKGKTALIIDDGIATGATTRAAIESARELGARKIVVAVPVAPPDTAEQLAKEVDEFICLATPELFGAVGQFYKEFAQTEDEEVIALMKQSKQP